MKSSLHYRIGRRAINAKVIASFAAIAAATICQPASGATWCVDQAKVSCFHTIGSAVTAAAPGDTVNVAPGTYAEDVHIVKSLYLIGSGWQTTIIDATGLANGVFIDGTASAPNTGVSDVSVSGFTVENANLEGILAANASYVTISDNEVAHNNKALIPSAQSCPGIPPYETNEDFDCGEGIHLLGSNHSIVSGNTSEHNAGGILLSDDTGPTHDNLITGNVVQENPYDCGITMASHARASIAGPGLPLGVFHNTISNNQSSRNGLGLAGNGAGVGLFAPGPGNQTYGNVVINNKLTDNGLPGVTMHNHASFPMAPPVNLNDNVIVGNQISGNAADTDDAATPGPTGINIFSIAPVTGLVIAHNDIDNEAIAVAIKTPSLVELHLNELTSKGTIGVANLGAGTVNATQNWWGCPSGATATSCSAISGAVVFVPSLTKKPSGSDHEHN
jgi:parallel beta-helix repeat protein